MKKLMMSALSLIAVVAFAGLVAADERPVEWSLPGRGQNCRFAGNFARRTIGRPTCGDVAYRLYNCAEWEDGLERQVGYLIVGEYLSDTPNSCSPTFVVREVVRQNVPNIVRP